MLLRTTLNGGLRQVQLSQRTLIVGPTGAGKTTMLASLGLVLTGQGDDLAGKVAVKSSAELAMTVEEDESIEIELEGGASRMKYKVVPGKKVAPDDAADPWRHPVRMVRDALLQEPTKARAQFAAWAFASPVPLERMLPHGMAEDPRFKAIFGASLDNPTVDDIAQAIELAKSEEDQRVKQAKADRAAVDALERTLGTPPTGSQIEAAEAAVRVLQEEAAGYEAMQQGVRAHEQRVGRIHAELKQIEASVQQLQGRWTAVAQQAMVELPPIPAGMDALHDQVELLDMAGAFVGTVLQRLPGTHCPTCGAATTRDALEARRVAIDGALQSLAARMHEMRDLTTATAEKERAQAMLETMKADHAGLVQRYQALHAELAALPPAPPPQPQLPELLHQLGQAQQTHAVLKSQGESWDRVRRLSRQASENEAMATWLAGVRAEFHRAIDRVYAERTAELEQRVSQFLPKGHKLALRLETASGRPTLRLGLIFPNGKRSLNPSGGQRGALFLAITCALIEMGRLPIPQEGPVFLFVPGECYMDADWLREVMTALSAVPCRVVLAAGHVPKRGKVKGWEIVELEPLHVSGEAEPMPLASSSSDAADLQPVDDAPPF